MCLLAGGERYDDDYHTMINKDGQLCLSVRNRDGEFVAYPLFVDAHDVSEKTSGVEDGAVEIDLARMVILDGFQKRGLGMDKKQVSESGDVVKLLDPKHIINDPYTMMDILAQYIVYDADRSAGVRTEVPAECITIDRRALEGRLPGVDLASPEIARGFLDALALWTSRKALRWLLRGNAHPERLSPLLRGLAYRPPRFIQRT